MADAKAVLSEAKNKGLKGEGFEQIEQRFIELGRDIEGDAVSRKSKEPPKETLQNLINLYTQSQIQKALIQSSKY